MKICKPILAGLCLLLTFSLLPIPALAASETTPSGVPISQIEEIVDEVMDERIGKDSPGAAVSVVKDGEIVFSKGYGVSNIEKNTPVSATDTVFEIGSISKTFTWTAVMQLVEAGELDLDTDIREYIGYDRLNLSFDEPITLLNLMNHTAGFEENASEMMTFDKEEIIPLEEWVSTEHQPKQIYKPGTVVAYSNFSTDIAGYIVQLKSGGLYEEYIQKNVFEPLDMNLSTAYADYYDIDEIVQRKSLGYAVAKDGFKLTPENFINEAPAGTITSTAEDMGKYMIAQMNSDGSANYELFDDPQYLQSFHKDSLHLYDGMASNAHGFWTRTESGVRMLEHGGNTTNFSALLSIVPEENFGICVLTNVASEAGIRTEIIRKLSAVTSHNAKVSVSEIHTEDLSGTYCTGRSIESNFLSSIYLLPSDRIQVKDLKNGELTVTLNMATGGDELHYAEVAPLVFERTDSEESSLEKAGATLSFLKFVPDETGEIQVVQTGNIRDYVKLPLNRNILLNQIFAITSILVFVIGSVAALGSTIATRRKRKKQIAVVAVPASGLRKLLPVTGLLCGINLILSIVRFMMAMTAPIASFRIHLILNALLLAVMLVTAGMLAVKSIGSGFTVKQKIWNIVLILATLIWTFLLYNYGHLSFWQL